MTAQESGVLICLQHSCVVSFVECHHGNGCPICDELHGLTDQIKVLTEQLTKDAVIVTGGIAKINTAHPIGLLQVMNGGTVEFGS